MQTVKAQNVPIFQAHSGAQAGWRGHVFVLAAQRLAPGIGLSLGVSGVAFGLVWLERTLFGGAWLEELVLAIIVGASVRAFAPLKPDAQSGINFCTKQVLDVAVMLLGCTVSTQVLLSAGVALPIGIACFVVLAIFGSYGLGRLFGLPRQLALLIACGNAICGNSAIAAVAPVIRAKGEDVAASISFTALLGVVLVLLLPLFLPLFHMQYLQYGVLAGLTVYAVPQVLAATAVFGPVAVQFGTLIKLTRVLMLGPVVVVLALMVNRAQRNTQPPSVQAGITPPTAKKAFALGQFVPWFIVGFLCLALLRSLDLLPIVCVPVAAHTSNILTIIAMAGLGLSTDLRAVGQCGVRVSVVVLLSLVMLLVAAFAFIALFGL